MRQLPSLYHNQVIHKGRWSINELGKRKKKHYSIILSLTHRNKLWPTTAAITTKPYPTQWDRLHESHNVIHRNKQRKVLKCFIHLQQVTSKKKNVNLIVKVHNSLTCGLEMSSMVLNPNFKIIYISNMNLMLISGCVKYHVLIYESCRIHPSELGRDYGVYDSL